MGFNTVAFILNDQMSSLERSPKTTIWTLTHPPMHENDTHLENVIRSVARENNEQPLGQALEVLPTFHADERKFLFAGGNCITELRFLRYGTDTKTKKKTVTLTLPDWWR